MSAAEKLIDDIQTAELITVDAKPASLRCNFDEVKARLSMELQKYDVVVTHDTLADAKKLATELNKNAGEFDRRRKDVVATVSGPIQQFEGQMKELVLMCKDGRQKILTQVQRYEDETRAAVLSLLVSERTEQWDKAGVEDEYRRAEIDDLVRLTAITKTGNLTAATLHTLGSRITADKQLQDRTGMRLVMLENQSYKAGLSAPLTRSHVEVVLFSDDAQYQANLDRIIQSELQRQEQAEAAMRARMERENEAKLQSDLAAQRRRIADEQEAQRREVEAQQLADSERSRQEEAAERKALAEQETMQAIREQAVSVPPVIESPAEPLAEYQAPAVDLASPHAIGALSSPTTATIIKCTWNDAQEQAIALDSDEPVGVWIPGQLVAIVYGGEVFHKA